MPVDQDSGGLVTDRLLLREWQEADRRPFAAMNADPLVMKHFPATMSREQSDGLVDRIVAGFAELGYGLFAVEVRESGRFAGFIGLAPVTLDVPFAPATEIGWRLASGYWNRGLATEGANAVVEHAFGPLGLDELVSFTATTNLASQRVMQKIGMVRDPADDFDHPMVEEGHRLRRHVCYRLARKTDRQKS